jgi:hypothetical protein
MRKLVLLTFVYLLLEDTKSRALTHEVPPHVDSSNIASEVSVCLALALALALAFASLSLSSIIV